MENKFSITDFSLELLCHVLKYLPLRELLSVTMLCKKISAAVDMHFKLCKTIDFCQDSILGYMPSRITDDHLLTLLKKCPHLEIIYGLHPVKIERRRLRKRAALTIPGIIEALSLCLNLKAVEISDLRLFEAIMQLLPQLEIIGNFQNRNGLFPPQASQRLKLQPYPRVSSLHLIGVEVPELTAMPHLQHLHLQCVRFTKLQPFRAFLAQNLKSFVMKHCIGPSVPQRYLSLVIALSASPYLNHLELVRVPLLNGLFQRAVEDSYRHNGFVNLRTLIISGCKGILEPDLGHLMIVSSKKLETLFIQPSLTKDSLFVSLAFAQCSFPVLRNLHLGYIDNLNSSGEWSNDTLLSFGLAEVPDTPSSITDSGMKIVSHLFPEIKSLSVSHCPHLMVMYQWMAERDVRGWSKLTDLTLQKCHCLQLSSFLLFISFLIEIQIIILKDMFREPPKGCSHVGLSAGTGLGMSSAVVSNQDEHIAVQGHHQEFEPPGDEEIEEIDREFIDLENDDNLEPQFMVLQRDFFDGEDNEAAVGNPRIENDQNPDIEDQGINIIFNEINNDSLPDENISNGIILDDSVRSSSVNNKYVSSETFTAKNQSHDKKELKYCLRNTNTNLKFSKSDCLQGDISQASCDSRDFKQKNDLEGEVSDKECYNSEINIEIPIVPEGLHNDDYDPHKPSTSKAGSHLDCSNWNDDYKCNKSSKRSNKCLNSKKNSKKQKISLKVTNDFTAAEKSKMDCKFFSQNNSFENNLNNCSDFKKDDHSNCVKKKLSGNISCDGKEKSIKIYASSDSDNLSKNISCCECLVDDKLNDINKNMCDAQKNSNEIPVSPNSNNISTLVPCYVLVKKLENKICTKISVSHAANKDNNRTVKVDNLSKKVSCCNCSHANEYKNALNDVNKNSSDMPPKSTKNDICPENCYPFLEDECSDQNRFNINCKAKVISDNYISQINEAQIDENVSNLSIAKSDHKIPINRSPVTDFNFTSKLSEKKCDINNVYELSEQEILLDSSFNKPTENCTHKVDNTITTVENVTINPDVLHLVKDENASVSKKSEEKFCKKEMHTGIQFNPVATQMYPNDHNDNDLDIKNIYVNENKTSPVHTPMNKLPEVFKSDSYRSEENLSEEITSEIMTDCDSLDSSKIIKPCCVLVSKLENIHTDFVKYSEDENENLNKNFKKEAFHDHDFGQAALSVFNENKLKNFEICPLVQPSTSKAGIDNPMRNSRTLRKMHSPKYFKRSSLNIKSESLNNNTAEKFSNKKLKYCPDSKAQNINATERKDRTSISESNTEPTHNLKKMEKSPKLDPGNDNYDEDNKFYVSMTDNKTREIFDSFTGKSYEIPHCHIVVTQTNNEMSDNFYKISKCKKKQNTSFSENSCDKKCDFNSEFNPHLPSTSRAGCQLNNISENVTYLNDKCKIDKKKLNPVKCFKSQNLSKCCCGDLGPQDIKAERLCIKNSDAMILLKQSNISKKDKYDDDQQIPSPLGTADTSSSQNGTYNSSFKQKFCNQSNALPISEYNYGHKIDDDDDDDTTVLGNKESSSNFGKKTHSTSSNWRKRRRRRKRKIIPFFKRIKKSLNCSRIKINNLSRDSTKNNTKRVTVPMISVISQATQATSADIRRSVRRIRSAAAHRKTVPSVYMSKSRYSSKISAKAVTKRPANIIPRPESHDKATSTSDPLLEEDAVQTLQLSSNSLLSFTLVSCGVSDLIIDQCPKLMHVEVQACRIMKNFQFNNCPALKRLNVSQCPKLNVSAVASPVMSLSTDSYLLASFEPCMQGYHPGEGEKAIIQKTCINKSILLLHDFCDISHDGIQATFREKVLEWLSFLSQLNLHLNHAREKTKRKKYKSEVCQFSEYPWSHDLRKIYGHYSYSSSSDFCDAEGQYNVLTNNPIFCDIFETSELNTGFPNIRDCAAFKDPSLISYEAVKKYLEMQKKFIAFYIPVTESNRINL